MNERTPILEPPVDAAPGFKPVNESGLLAPVGYENVVNPEHSVLNKAMEIGKEQGLGSVRYQADHEADRQEEANDKAFDDILDPRNVIDLKQAIDNKANKRNDEESHLGNVKDGSRPDRENNTRNAVRGAMVEDYLHIGDPENEREIPEVVRGGLESMLNKSYAELEEMIAKREAANAKQSPDNSKDEQSKVSPRPNLIRRNGNGDGKEVKSDPTPRSNGEEDKDSKDVKSDKDDVKDKPPVKQPADEPIPRRVQPDADRKQPAPEKDKSKRKKIMAAVGALLVAVGLGSTAAQEDKWVDLDIGNHGGNVEDIKDIDEGDNALGKAGVSDEVRSHVAQNAERAGQFFEAVSTEAGQENFEQFESALEDAKQWFAAKHPELSDKRVAELAEAQVRSQLDALQIAELEKAAEEDSDS